MSCPFGKVHFAANQDSEPDALNINAFERAAPALEPGTFEEARL
jgi:hypothetical protein